MGQAAPPANTQTSLARLKNYAAQPDPGLQQGKAFPTRKMSPEELAALKEQHQQQQGTEPPEAPTPETPSLGPNDLPIKNIETRTVRIPGFLGSLPEPSSLVVPLLVIVLFWMLIIKVNGKSRFQWLWEVLLGDAVVAPGGQASANSAAASLANDVLNAEQAAILNGINNVDVNATVTELRDSSFQPLTFGFTPSSAIAVTSTSF